MILLGNILNIVIFVTLVGSVFSILTFLSKRVLRMALPLWFGICGIIFFLVPFIVPILYLFPPEEPQWLNGYKIACNVWLAGLLVFLVYFSIRSLFAYCAIKNYRACSDERINQAWHTCVKASGLKKAPVVFSGTLNDSACVASLFRPFLILNENIIKQLSDKELNIVLYHEITHIKRRHHIYQALTNIAFTIHWFNPFVWFIKSDFAMQCEIDCDKNALSALKGSVTEIEYATAMLHLMELSANAKNKNANGIGALGFILAKQRMYYFLNIPSRCRKIIGTTVLVLSIAITLLFSTFTSRSIFYPYPAYSDGTEFSGTFIAE